MASVRVFCPPRRRLHCPSIDIQNPSRSRKNRETVEIERIAVKRIAKWKEFIHEYNAGCCFPIEKMLVCSCVCCEKGKGKRANRLAQLERINVNHTGKIEIKQCRQRVIVLNEWTNHFSHT